MLDLFGKRYVIDHCISCWNAEMREKAYRGYLTDVLRLIGENIATVARGAYITNRWLDLADEKKPDNRSADEIAAEVILKAGLSFGGDT